jgi:phage virion morphogenesis protein
VADTDLTKVEDWLEGLMLRLSDGQRRKLSMKIGRSLRRSNAKRIAANVEPDGGAMAPRKPRLRPDGSKVRRSARMFRRLRQARNLRIKAAPDSVELNFGGGSIEKIAAIHHDGQVGLVGRTREGRTIRARYEARRLLGFGANDMDIVMEEVTKTVSGD